MPKRRNIKEKNIEKHNIQNNEENVDTNSIKNNEKENKNFKSILKEYFKNYNENLKIKHIVCFIIMVIIFGGTLISYISNLQNQDFLEQVQNISGQYSRPNIFTEIFTGKLPIILIIIIAGVTPYIYASAIGVLFSYQIAEEIIKVLSIANSQHNIVLMCIGAIIQLIGFSLAISTGIYWCRISGKRRKYMNGTQKSFLDIKKEYYNLTNNKKKIKELEKKRKEKKEKIEKYNINIPYLTFIISFIISMLIVSIGTIIFYIL